MEVVAAIKRIKAQLGFEGFEITKHTATKEQVAQLKTFPKMSQPCIVKTHPTKSGSAFGGMKEVAYICGYMGTDNGIKALVVYRDIEDDRGNHDFGFVDLTQVKPFVEKEKTYHAYAG